MPTGASPLIMVVVTGAKDSTRRGFCLASALTKSSHLSPLNLFRFHRNWAVVVWRVGSGMVIFPVHLELARSSNVFGISPVLTISVLYRMLMGRTRQGVIIPSFSLNCAGNFSDDGGIKFLERPSSLMVSWTPRLPSTTSKPGLPARHSVSARSETCVDEPRQYSTVMPYFFSNSAWSGL